MGKIPTEVADAAGRMPDEGLVAGVEGISEINLVEVRVAVLTERGARMHTGTVLADLSELAVWDKISYLFQKY